MKSASLALSTASKVAKQLEACTGAAVEVKELEATNILVQLTSALLAARSMTKDTDSAEKHEKIISLCSAMKRAAGVAAAELGLAEQYKLVLKTAAAHVDEQQKDAGQALQTKLSEHIESLQKQLMLTPDSNVEHIVWYKGLEKDCSLKRVLEKAKGTIMSQKFAEKLTHDYACATQVSLKCCLCCKGEPSRVKSLATCLFFQTQKGYQLRNVAL